jgi:plasmid stabilization system protein ParE
VNCARKKPAVFVRRIADLRVILAGRQMTSRAIARQSGNCIFCRQSFGWLKIHDGISRFVGYASVLQPEPAGNFCVWPISATRAPESHMPRGDKSAYTNRQKRKAEHIEEGYEKRGVNPREAERRAWATVNKEEGGGNKSGSGRGVRDTKVSSRKGGRIGGRAAAKRSAAARSASARKGAATRKRNAAARKRTSTR